MMKRLRFITMALLLGLLCLLAPEVQPTIAQENLLVNDQLIAFKINDTNYYTQTIGSELVNTAQMDTAPIIELNRTFVPVRFLGNALGVSDNNIEWDNTTRTASLKGSNKLDLVIGKKAISVNGLAETIDVAPMITNSRTMLPARFVAKGLGFRVDWDADNQLVIVYQGEKPDVSAILAKIKGEEIGKPKSGKIEWKIIRRDVGRTIYIETAPGETRYFRFVCTSHPELNYKNTYDWDGNPKVQRMDDGYTTTYELAPGGQAYNIKLAKGMVVTFDVYEKINGVEIKVDTIVETL